MNSALGGSDTGDLGPSFCGDLDALFEPFLAFAELEFTRYEHLVESVSRLA